MELMETKNDDILRLKKVASRVIPDSIGKLRVPAVILIGLICLLPLSIALSFQVPSLPSGNLLSNPWFRTQSEPVEASLDGWTRVVQNQVGWGLSHKASNPSPNIIISGRCGFEPVYCGTAARWAEQDGVIYPNIDAVLYQVVSADSNDRQLKFMTHWVTHIMEVAEVTIYGSSSNNGPWTKLWVPFFHSQYSNPAPPDDQSELWQHTGMVETTLAKGYNYYKVEIHGRYPQPPSPTVAVGFKLTGIYFTTASTNATPGPTQTPSTSPTPKPSSMPSPTSTASPPPSELRYKAYIPQIIR